MKPIYQSFLFMCFALISICTPSWAGAPIPTLTHSPTNPVAGQTVTFSVSDSDVSSCNIVKVAPDLVNYPDSLLDLTLVAGFYTATFVYPSPGTYQIGYDVTPNPACIFFNRQPKNTNRALQTFNFGPVGGP